MVDNDIPKLSVERVRALLQDESEKVRTAAAKALGKMGSRARNAVPSLIKATEENRIAMNLCNEVIQKIGCPSEKELSDLIELTKSKNDWVRMKAIELIGDALEEQD